MFLLQQIRVIKFQVGLVIVEIRKGGVGILAVCIVSGCKKMSPILKDNSEKIFPRRKIDKDIVARNFALFAQIFCGIFAK